MPHAGDERLLERAIVSPFREHLVDGRVVDQGGPVGRPGYWHALPLHTRIENLQDQIENAMIAQFTFRSAAGHRKVREDKCDELRPGELHGNRRRGLALCHIAHPDMAREKHERRWPESPNTAIIQLVKETLKFATTYDSRG